MHSLKDLTPPSGATGGAWPDDDEAVTMGHVRRLRRECRMWRLQLAEAQKENARLRIALVILEAGGTPSNAEGQ